MNSTSVYSHFVAQCATYKIKVKVGEDKYMELRERFYERGWATEIQGMIDRCWAKDIPQVNAMSIINRFKFAKDFARQDAEKKEEQKKTNIKRDEEVQVARGRRKDEIAREKSRKGGTFVEPSSSCKIHPAVLDFKEKNPKRYEDGIQHFIDEMLAEHKQGTYFFGKRNARVLAEARLRCYLEDKITKKQL